MTETTHSADTEGAIEAEGIHKTFGVQAALRGISFSLRKGEFLTIFGPNGAGKTTLLKILAGLAKPTRGTARVAGFDVLEGDPGMKRQIGVIAHASCLYSDLSAVENLIFYAKMYGLGRPEERAVRAIENVGLKARMHDRVRTYSRGMQQRVSIARAVLHDPPILFLDEPFTGLDPQGSNNLKETLRALHTDKRTVLMTTHDIACGLELSDKVAVQSKGRFVLYEDACNLEKHRFEDLYFEILADRLPAEKTAPGGPGR
ncbi:MAG: heme ABC exporter ATP-binding protein CcmA [Nitrospinaceae bacterium]|jgi:heme exporter protein A|nr:MAG: heme ABC exporter ATP-binding protein CcmA [Nitrospinaceae bacterium]